MQPLSPQPPSAEAELEEGEQGDQNSQPAHVLRALDPQRPPAAQPFSGHLIRQSKQALLRAQRGPGLGGGRGGDQHARMPGLLPGNQQQEADDTVELRISQQQLHVQSSGAQYNQPNDHGRAARRCVKASQNRQHKPQHRGRCQRQATQRGEVADLDGSLPELGYEQRPQLGQVRLEARVAGLLAQAVHGVWHWPRESPG